MNKENNNYGAALGTLLDDLSKLLTLVFCVLRACDVITWKWYYVMAPMLIAEAIGVVCLIIAGAATISIIRQNK